LHTAPRGFSQCATSFIGSGHRGIHRVPLVAYSRHPSQKYSLVKVQQSCKSNKTLAEWYAKLSKTSNRTFRYGYCATPTSTRLDPADPRLTCRGLRSDPRGRIAVSDMKGAWERIHRRIADRRLLATPPSCSRVADCNPNLAAINS
jgi:hypothetical protein